VITVTNLVKRYGEVTALQDLSLRVPAGTVFGVLGPNGAGKTTLLRLMVGLIFPDSGSIELQGCPRHRLGYLPERPHFPGRFRVEEYMLVAGQLSGLAGPQLRAAVSAALAQTGLSQVADRRIAACSKGMLQRLGLAQCLLTDPPLILLDEPLSGLDPAAQAAMRHLVSGLSRSGRTILLSTHRLADVSQMCSHIAILARGRLSRCGPLPQVLAPRSHLLIQVDRLPDAVSQQIFQLHPAVALNGTEIVLADEAVGVKRQILQILLDAQVDILRLESQGATLEEVYLEAVRPRSEP
jgi:ABC-2 type transport system ATP-binding protein